MTAFIFKANQNRALYLLLLSDMESITLPFYIYIANSVTSIWVYTDIFQSGVLIVEKKKVLNANEQLSYCGMINIPFTDQSRFLSFSG